MGSNGEFSLIQEARGISMIELFFDQSTCNSFRMATMIDNSDSFQVCASIEMIDNSDCVANEHVEDEEGKIIGEFSDVFGLQLGLSAGDISDCTKRQHVLAFIYEEAIESKRIKKIITDIKADLDCIHQRLTAGEAIRIWYSDIPDDLCGFYWFMFQLKQWELTDVQVMTVRLPKWMVVNHTVWCKYTWGEVLPEQWHQYIHLQKEMPKEVINSYADHWQKLKLENAPLRVVLNGKLVSVNEAFYDPFIKQCLMSLDNEFTEAQCISKILNEQLGITFSIIRSRVEMMIQEGKLDVVDDVKGYQRRLRKT